MQDTELNGQLAVCISTLESLLCADIADSRAIRIAAYAVYNLAADMGYADIATNALATIDAYKPSH